MGCSAKAKSRSKEKKFSLNKMGIMRERAVKWYRDRKLIIAFVIIVISFILGAYSKAIIIIKFYEPIYLITGLSLYTFSWILLFVGVFMVGWRTVKAMQARMQHEVGKSVKKTYHHARKLPGKAATMAKNLHKKGMDKLNSTSKAIVEKRKHKKEN